MIIHQLPPFQNVGANKTAVMPSVHSGQTVVGIVLKLSGTTFTKSHLNQMRISFDGKQFVDNVSGNEIVAITDYENHGANAAFVYIPFGDLRAMTQRGQMMGAVDTSVPNIKPMSMAVDIGGATAPVLEGWVILAPPKASDDPNKNTIRAFLKTTNTPTGAGTFPYPLPLGSKDGGLIHRIYHFHSNVSKISVKKDGLHILEEGEEAVLDFVYNLKDRADQAGLIVFDPTFTNAQTDSISTLRPNGQPATFDFRFTTTAADTIKSITSLYTTISNV